MQTQRLSEIELIKRAPEDLEAFGEIVERYRNTITRQCFSRVKDRDHAEDLAQETFVRAYLKLDQLKDPTRFPNWLRKIASNVCNEFIRSSQRREWAWKILPDLLPEAEITSPLDLPLDVLPEKSRECIELFYMEGLSLEEIAGVTGSTIPSVRARLQRAKAVLQKEMTELTNTEKSAFTQRVLDELNRLKSRDSEERSQAARKLHFTLAEDKVDWIVSLLRDPSPAERGAAARSSKKYRSSRVRDALVDMMQNDEWEENRMRAAGALAAQGDPSVVPYLKQAMEAPNNPKEVVAAAKSTIKHLEKLEEPVYPDVEQRKLRQDVAIAAGDKKARVELLQRLKTALKDPDQKVRSQAIKALHGLGDRRAVPAIAKLLYDPVPGIRNAAAIALGAIGGKQTVTILTRMMEETNDRMLLQSIMLSLLKSGDRLALPAIMRAIYEKWDVWKGNGGMFMFAMNFAYDYATPEDLPVIKEALDRLTSEHHEAKKWTLWAWMRMLSKLADERHTAEVIENMQKFPLLGRYVQTLARIGDENAVAALQEHFRAHPSDETAEALAQCGEAGMDILRGALNSENPQMRASASHGIVCAGGDKASEIRLKELAKNDPSTRVRYKALHAVRKSRTTNDDEWATREILCNF